MHTDENKRFDKRNIERNIKSGIITQKDYEFLLSKLPDLSDKVYDSGEEPFVDSTELKPRGQGDIQVKRKAVKKKSKGKGK